MDANTVNKSNHSLYIDNNLIKITGIKKVKVVNDNTFIGQIDKGTITITGSAFELVKLDVDNGNVELKGTVNSVKYSGSGATKQSLLKRIFG